MTYPSPAEWRAAWEAKIKAEEAAMNERWATHITFLLNSGTFNEVRKLKQDGLITNEQWCEYCYRWRDQSFRYSNTGMFSAAEHARRNGLPLPYSDRDLPEEGDDGQRDDGPCRDCGSPECFGNGCLCDEGYTFYKE